jgi:hypothetical protein
MKVNIIMTLLDLKPRTNVGSWRGEAAPWSFYNFPVLESRPAQPLFGWAEE